MRRFFLSLMASLNVVTIVLGFPMLASAASSLPDWFSKFDYYVERYGSSSLPKNTSQVLNADYVRAVESGSAPAAPSGTGVTDAIKGGFSDFYVRDSGGSIHRISMSDYQHQVADTFTESYKSQASIADQAGASMQDYLKAQSAKINTTSGEMSRAAKSTGIKPSTLYSTAKSDAGVIQVSGKELATNMGKIRDTSGNVIDTTGTVLSEQTLKSGFVSSATRILGKAFAIAGAAQFGFAVGNGVVSVFGIDQSAECQTISNGVARFLLGIDSTCQSYDDAKVPVAGSSTYHFEGTCTSKYSAGYIVLCLDSLNLSTGSMTLYNHSSDTWYYAQPDLFAVFDQDTLYITSHGTSSSLLPGQSVVMSGYPRHMYYGSFMHCTYQEVAAACASAMASTFKNVYTGGGDWHQSGVDGVSPAENRVSSIDTPDATPSVDVVGSDGKTYHADGDAQSQGGRMRLPSVALPDGVTPQTVAVSKKSSDGLSQTIVPRTDVSPKAQTGPDTTITTDDGTLDLIDQATGKSCYLEAYACADWPAQVMTKTGKAVTLSNTATTAQAADMPYKCSWQSGGKTTELTIGECTVLSNAFVQANLEQGTTSSDPETGVKSGDKTDTDPDGDVSYGQCVTSQVSWNPVSWVYVPVKCALKWAFEPDRQVVTTTQVQVRQKAHYGVIGQIQDNFNANFVPNGGDDDSCKGPEFHLEYGGTVLIQPSYPMSVCPGSGKEIAPLISKAAIIALLCIVCLFSVTKGIQIIVGIEHHRDSGSR